MNCLVNKRFEISKNQASAEPFKRLMREYSRLNFRYSSGSFCKFQPLRNIKNKKKTPNSSIYFIVLNENNYYVLGSHTTLIVYQNETIIQLAPNRFRWQFDEQSTIPRYINFTIKIMFALDLA